MLLIPAISTNMQKTHFWQINIQKNIQQTYHFFDWGSDEPVFYLNQASTKSFLENRGCGKIYAQQQIVAVSLGEFGLECITANNKPECNRVYSSDGSVHEPGFISTPDFGLQIWGFKTYFTPIGWCPWAINVDGLNSKRTTNWREIPKLACGVSWHKRPY